MERVTVISPSQDRLGESPLLSATRKSLLWVDTPAGLLHCVDPVSHKTITCSVPAPLAFIAEEPTGGLLLGIGCHLAVWHEHAPVTYLSAAPHQHADFQLNDAKMDAAGRLWCGLINKYLNADSGYLYCIDPDGIWQTKDTNFTLINGIAWSTDNKTLFVTDSVKRVIYAYDYMLSDGTISHKRVFYRFTPAQGKPDGLTIGSDDYLLSVLFDGSAVARISPCGQHVQFIDLPVPRPTSCCFDENEHYLYVTSARIGLTPQMLSAFPLSGGVLRVDMKGY